MKKFVDKKSNTNISHGLVVKSRLMPGVPNCSCLHSIQPQKYLRAPSGGPCQCGTVPGKPPKKDKVYKKTGYVYIWTTTTNQNSIVKIGCNKDYGNSNEENCFRRIGQEFKTRQTNDFKVIIFCAKIKNDFKYTLERLTRKNQDYNGCNAAELTLQAYLYCEGRWNGKTRKNLDPGKNLPDEANPQNGHTEWYYISFADAVKLFSNRVNNVEFANSFTVLIKQNKIKKSFTENVNKIEVKPFKQFP
mmetsp:Transcript_3709/g.6886  ORF Transcript_3709/g.6886 Transcript_3709/m.6886 type:complete len:246 (-) Transcript_3709:98-835(-)